MAEKENKTAQKPDIAVVKVNANKQVEIIDANGDNVVVNQGSAGSPLATE